MSDLDLQQQEAETVETVQGNEPKIIPADNPSSEEMKAICEEVKTSLTFECVPTETDFTFKKKVTEGIETKRETLKLPLPFPTLASIVSFIESDSKVAELIRDAVNGVISDQARSLITEDESLNAVNFPYEKLTLNYIASIPKATRRGGGIPKEQWEAFVADYIAIMPEASGRSIEQCKKAAQLFAARLTPVKTNKQVLAKLQEFIAIYAEAKGDDIEEFSDVVEYLLGRIETLMNDDGSDLLAAL